jgi:hypothetical protein
VIIPINRYIFFPKDIFELKKYNGREIKNKQNNILPIILGVGMDGILS